MSHEREHTSEYFEATGVSRGEFEALKRFGDYKELADGTLMRVEGKKEFRIYCEDSGWLTGRNGGRGVVVTSGFCRMLSEAHNRVVEKVKKDPDYRSRLREGMKKHFHGIPPPSAVLGSPPMASAAEDSNPPVRVPPSPSLGLSKKIRSSPRNTQVPSSNGLSSLSA